jgi:hypothetical protein
MTGRTFFRSRAWRVTRWVGLAAALPVLWACNSRTLEQPIINPTSSNKNTFQETLNRKIDILFMIDNSSSMELSQANLKANLPSFMNVLKGLPDGLPDLHIGVVSSDMGAGDGSITGCAGNGDNGVFHFAPTGDCASSPLQSGATYISSPIGGTPNFTGDITAAFQCIAQLGASGCGFEHQLASVSRALGADGAAPPQENSGFIRPEAYLAIVFITNEDDCSAPNGTIFDTNSNTNLAAQVGPPGNFRCNEFGHLCSLNGGPPAPPLRVSPNPTDLNFTQSYDNCVSSEGMGLLTPVDTFLQQIKKLKTDPANQILVASIQGPVTPYVEHWKAAPIADSGPWPEIMHSCPADVSQQAQVGFADPGVRMQQFVQGFGGNGLVYPICSNNFGPSLQTIAQKLSALIGPSCITGKIANRTGTSTPDCTVTQTTPDGMGGNKQDIIPNCDDNGGAKPCWTLQSAQGMNCPANSQIVKIDRGGAMAPDNTRNAVDCSMCISGFPDMSRGCP